MQRVYGTYVGWKQAVSTFMAANPNIPAVCLPFPRSDYKKHTDITNSITTVSVNPNRLYLGHQKLLQHNLRSANKNLTSCKVETEHSLSSR